MTIHQRIKKARELKGWSMAELAEKVGYAGATAIAKVEAGERSVNHEMLKKYAESLEVSPMWLLYGDENESVKRDWLTVEMQNQEQFLKTMYDYDFSFIASEELHTGQNIIAGDRVFVKKKDTIRDGELVLVSVGISTCLVYWYYEKEVDTIVICPYNENFEKCDGRASFDFVFPPSKKNVISYLGSIVKVMHTPRIMHKTPKITEYINKLIELEGENGNHT